MEMESKLRTAVSSHWLTKDLHDKVRKVFEPRYKRQLTDSEVEKIAENLTEVMEALLKLRWKEKYGKGI